MTLALHKAEPDAIGCWEDGFQFWPVVINVPDGLEGACAGIARREGRLRLKALCPGFLVASKTSSERLTEAMRNAPTWSFGSFVLASTLPPGDRLSSEAIDKITSDLNSVIDQFQLQGRSYWLNCPATESDVARKLRGMLLQRRDLAIINNPSNYSLTIRLATDGAKVHVLIGPSISIKRRFAYRRRDVGASINPVLAAAMVRLAPPVRSGLALDPTCGSGTLLAERLAYSDEDTALGIDLSAEAGEAFQANLQQGVGSGQFRFRLGDGADRELWQPCQTVLANLPFGIRLRVPRPELEALYAAIMNNSARFLAADGRVVLTSSFKGGLDHAIAAAGDSIRVLSRYKAKMGGLFYQILVATKA